MTEAVQVSQDSDWAMSWTTGVRFPARARIFSSSPPRPDTGAHPTSYPKRTVGVGGVLPRG